MTQYKLLILQTTCQFSGKAWLHYDTAFRKDAAAAGLSDWSRMNSDLYNFHTRLPQQQQFQPPTTSSSPSRSIASSTIFCRSWNNGSCTWPYGQCRYRSRKELESLIGTLHHTCKVIPQGYTFIRRMINLLSVFRHDDHPIRLNREFHLDLSWWREFFISWDGLSFLLSPTWAPLPDFLVSSDAAGALGYGTISSHDWFVLNWSAAQQPLSITYKELFPVVMATALWGHRWATKRVEFCSDNMAVVSVLRSGSFRDPNMMVLLRYLSLVAARNSFAFTTSLCTWAGQFY